MAKNKQVMRVKGGSAVQQDRLVQFTFDGKSYMGCAGDTLASALLANNVHLVGRSFKYHRPRGIMAAGAEEANALVQLGTDGRVEPNLRATQVELYDGLVAKSQNRFPTLKFDVGQINSLLSRFFPAGFYYKTFMWPAVILAGGCEPVKQFGHSGPRVGFLVGARAQLNLRAAACGG